MLAELLFIAVIIALILVLYKIKFSSENVEREKESVKKQLLEQQSEVKSTAAHEEEPEWIKDSSDEDEGYNVKKQLHRQHKKNQKQQRKAAHEQYLESLKKDGEEYDKLQMEKEKEEEAKRRKEEQVIEQMRQDERKRNQAQFNKWKDMFSVEESGKSKLSQDQQAQNRQAFKRNLLDTLTRHKLSLLEDLSHKFKLNTKEVINEIKQLQNEQRVSGIFDERGKYMVIEETQWQAIKQYISNRGRVKKTDIMTECARLIKIPDSTEQGLLDLVKADEE